MRLHITRRGAVKHHLKNIHINDVIADDEDFYDYFHANPIYEQIDDATLRIIYPTLGILIHARAHARPSGRKTGRWDITYWLTATDPYGKPPADLDLTILTLHVLETTTPPTGTARVTVNDVDTEHRRNTRDLHRHPVTSLATSTAFTATLYRLATTLHHDRVAEPLQARFPGLTILEQRRTNSGYEMTATWQHHALHLSCRYGDAHLRVSKETWEVLSPYWEAHTPYPLTPEGPTIIEAGDLVAELAGMLETAPHLINQLRKLPKKPAFATGNNETP